MFIDFKDGIPKDVLFYCYSPQAKCEGVFVREDDCIKNEYNATIGDYEYTTLMFKERVGVGASVTIECDFERRGAPLIVLSDVIEKRGNSLYYGEHFESVAFEEGFNVWYNRLAPEGSKKPLISEKLHHEPIPTPNRSRVTLTVELLPSAIRTVMNGVEVVTHHEAIPEKCYFGITACEGINRIYSAKLEYHLDKDEG